MSPRGVRSLPPSALGHVTNNINYVSNCTAICFYLASFTFKKAKTELGRVGLKREGEKTPNNQKYKDDGGRRRERHKRIERVGWKYIRRRIKEQNKNEERKIELNNQ